MTPRRALSAVLSLGLLTPTASHAASPGRFDGKWAVTLACQPSTDGALPYNFHFVAEVKDSTVHGEHGLSGYPDWLVIDGSIDAAGDAAMIADGLTGKPDHTLGHVATGQPYTYRIKAHFDPTHGTGQRIGARVCTLDFVKV